jgi:predicted PurR-regulated permease PerM
MHPEPDRPDPAAAEHDPPPPPPPPDLHRLGEAIEKPMRSIAVTGLFVLASFYTLYFCRTLLLPLVTAALLAMLCAPAVRTLKRWRVPEAVGAALVVLSLLAVLGCGLYSLSGPAVQWVERAPQSLRSAQAKLRNLQRSMRRLGRATEEVEKIAGSGVDAGTPRQAAVAVAVQAAPSLRERLWSGATDLAGDAVVMIVLLYFLLASNDLLLHKLIRVLPRREDKRRVALIARQVERDVSAYLSTVTLINLGLGTAVALAFALVGVPNPLLWGAMVAVVNFIPYLGPALDYAVFLLVGVLTFDSLPHMLLPAGIFLALNVLEAYLLTPLILGRRLTLNPVVLFVGLTFWGWMWGVVGAILAVPIMVVCKILCDHIEPLAPIGELLGR